jgi:hypothetical protein
MDSTDNGTGKHITATAPKRYVYQKIQKQLRHGGGSLICTPLFFGLFTSSSL